MRAVQLLVSLSSVFAADELFFCSPVEGTMPATNDAIVRERCLTQGLSALSALSARLITVPLAPLTRAVFVWQVTAYDIKPG